MSTTNTGGLAFPCHTIAMHEGMTLRDYFAAKAMQGLLAADVEFSMSPDEVSKLSYFQADSMLRERNK